MRTVRASIAGCVVALLAGSGVAAAHQANTQSVAGFSTNPAPEGTPVALKATVTFTGTFGGGPATGHGPLQVAGQPVVGDSVNFQILTLAGSGVECGTAGASYSGLGHATTNAAGVATLATPFDTTGLGGSTIGFRVLHPTGGPSGPHRWAQSTSECANLEITRGDPFPDGTLSYTQGYYGSSPDGEASVESLLDADTCEAIASALGSLDVAPATDCTEQGSRAALAYLLTGPVGPGPERPRGFLPSGFAPGHNLVAQLATLLLNLNYGAIAAEGEYPLEGGYYLNVDAVQDLVDGAPAGWVDPILATGGELGTCVDASPLDDVCDGGTVTFSGVGEEAAALDAAGTTVDELVAAAFAFLGSGLATTDLHGVDLDAGDLTALIGLVNESYDEGEPTGFVAAFDAD